MDNSSCVFLDLRFSWIEKSAGVDCVGVRFGVDAKIFSVKDFSDPIWGRGGNLKILFNLVARLCPWSKFTIAIYSTKGESVLHPC